MHGPSCHCHVNGIVNDNAFLLLSLAYRLVSSFCVDVDCDGKHVLVAEAYGRAILLGLAPEGLADGARTETRFSLRDAESQYGACTVHAFGALFVERNHDYIIFDAVGQ